MTRLKSPPVIEFEVSLNVTSPGLLSSPTFARFRVVELRPCKLETEQLKAVTDWLENVQKIWEGNYKRLDALLAELKQAQKEERKK